MLQSLASVFHALLIILVIALPAKNNLLSVTKNGVSDSFRESQLGLD
jgi:hypothetical protein